MEPFMPSPELAGSSLALNPFRGLCDADVQWASNALVDLSRESGRQNWLKAQDADSKGRYSCALAHLAAMKHKAVFNPPAVYAERALAGWVNRDPDLAWIYSMLASARLDPSDVPLRPLSAAVQISIEPPTQSLPDLGANFSLF